MRPIRTVSIFPTLLTLGNLVCGFFAIVVAARVEKVTDVVQEGQQLTVIVTEIDHMGRVNLATKEAVDANPALLTEHAERRPPRRDGDRPRGGGYDRPRGGSGDRRPGGFSDRPPRRDG